DAELEIDLLFAFDDAGLDFRDSGSPVVRVNDRLANLKKHAVMSFRQLIGYHRRHTLRLSPAPSGTVHRGRAKPHRMQGLLSSALGGSVIKSRLVASVALAVAVAVGTSGCAMVSTQATTIPYSPADGVNIPDSGPLKVRNVLIVADEEGIDGNL